MTDVAVRRSRGEAVHICLLILLSCLLGCFAIFRSTTSHLNADTIVQSLSSLQNLTLFYWAQDRFLNIVPILSSIIQEPLANLWTIMFVYSTSFYAFIIFLAWFGSKFLGVKDKSFQWFAVGLALCMVFISMSSAMHATFTIEGQPYGLSYFLIVISVYFLFEKRKYYYLLMAPLIFISIGMNPSIIIVSFFVSIFILIYRDIRTFVIFLFVALTCFIFWSFASRYSIFFQGNNYNRIIFPRMSDVIIVIYNIKNSFSIYFFGIFLLMIPIVILIDKDFRVKFVLFISIFLIYTWLFVFSSNQWIALNGHHYRYFFTIIFSIYIFIGVCIIKFFLNYVKPETIKLITFPMFAFILYYSSAPYAEIAKSEIFRQQEEIVKFAIERDIRFVGGQYWRSWPTVHSLLQREHVAYGLGYRAIANKSINRSALRDVERALCIAQPLQTCLDEASAATGLRWQPSEGSCGAECLIFELKPVGVRP